MWGFCHLHVGPRPTFQLRSPFGALAAILGLGESRHFEALAAILGPWPKLFGGFSQHFTFHQHLGPWPPFWGLVRATILRLWLTLWGLGHHFSFGHHLGPWLPFWGLARAAILRLWLPFWGPGQTFFGALANISLFITIWGLGRHFGASAAILGLQLPFWGLVRATIFGPWSPFGALAAILGLGESHHFEVLAAILGPWPNLFWGFSQHFTFHRHLGPWLPFWGLAGAAILGPWLTFWGLGQTSFRALAHISPSVTIWGLGRHFGPCPKLFQGLVHFQFGSFGPWPPSWAVSSRPGSRCSWAEALLRCQPKLCGCSVYFGLVFF